MFAGAKSDFQPHLPRRRDERAPLGQALWRNREQRQRLGEQTFLARAKHLAAAVSVEARSHRRVFASVDACHSTRPGNHQLRESAQRIREISLFPREPAVGLRRAAEMAIGRCPREDWTVQVEMLANASGLRFITSISAISSLSSSMRPVSMQIGVDR